MDIRAGLYGWWLMLEYEVATAIVSFIQWGNRVVLGKFRPWLIDRLP